MNVAETRKFLTETQFLEMVVARAHALGWMVHHDRPARTDRGWRTAIQGDAGFPDLVLARDGRVIFAELKSEKGRLRTDQVDWLDVLAPYRELDLPARQLAVHVWRPSDWPDICEILE